MPTFGDDPRGFTRQAPAAAATFAKGEVLAGKYRIEKVLGRGGMGHVFAAMHLDLDQLVAIKVMHKDMLTDADSVMRFGREDWVIIFAFLLGAIAIAGLAVYMTR